ncbi:MAG: sigma 54-interacting transcriptional regulator [Rhodospirillales bacterium]|nr:sigma 54-interacting transcriptional regulator [Rhodospirillales bacterium]
MADRWSDFEDRLAALRSSFQNGLGERIADLENAAKGMSASEDDATARSALAEVRKIVHRLAGSGTTFGFPEVTQNARELEDKCDERLATDARPDAADLTQLSEFIETLREAAAAPAKTAADAQEDPEEEALENGADDGSARQHRVLLVEDDRAQARAVEEFLKDEQYSIVRAETGGAALDVINENVPDAVLLDMMLPDMDGIDILRQIAERQLPCAVVVITAHGSVNLAVEAMRLGAYDFIIKPFNVTRLQVTVRNALEQQRLSRIVETYQDLDRSTYFGFIGASLPMQAVYRIIDSAAGSKATVFISGESGTGKEVCAEALHRKSPRADKPFVAINCGAIPKDLMESEIFGHVKGAFTGAVSDREGAARRANGGTLFLDEVCELDPSLQTKLLRFVQTGTYQRVGGDRTEEVDVRFVCATNRDPMTEVTEGRFREDLFYRLHVVPIQLPPLRERGEDVVLIAQQLLGEYSGEEGKRLSRFSDEVKGTFQSYAWPGNVREVQNVLRHIIVLNDGDEVTHEMLPHPLNLSTATGISQARARPPSPAGDTPPARRPDIIRPLAEVEKEAIDNAIRLCDGNIPKAAHFLGVSASTIYRKKQLWESG